MHRRKTSRYSYTNFTLGVRLARNMVSLIQKFRVEFPALSRVSKFGAGRCYNFNIAMRDPCIHIVGLNRIAIPWIAGIPIV